MVIQLIANKRNKPASPPNCRAFKYFDGMPNLKGIWQQCEYIAKKLGVDTQFSEYPISPSVLLLISLINKHGNVWLGHILCHSNIIEVEKQYISLFSTKLYC